MTDLPTPERAPQLCVGPDGHATEAPLRRHVPVAGFTYLSIAVIQAPVGQPCVTVYQWQPDGGKDWRTLHANTADLIFHWPDTPDTPDAPDASLPHIRLALDFGDDGTIGTSAHVFNLDGLPVASVEYILRGWEAVRATSVRPGRKRGQTSYSTPQQKYEIARDIDAQLAEGKSWKDIITHARVRYPEREQEGGTWNRKTLGRWVRDLRATRFWDTIGTEIEAAPDS